TKHLQTLKVHQRIQKQLGMLKEFKFEQGTYSIELSGKMSTAKLELQENRVIIVAEGTYEAETIFFEVLRKCEPFFLAIDLEHERYGWLKPLKERKFV
ncbi:MAG TPA: sporulation inhibitor of replication protein SirA, partial [Bacillales bacterium]|nr:sporulation inhibitor of replication protein SirA [Bacillales bacterium]